MSKETLEAKVDHEAVLNSVDSGVWREAKTRVVPDGKAINEGLLKKIIELSCEVDRKYTFYRDLGCERLSAHKACEALAYREIRLLVKEGESNDSLLAELNKRLYATHGYEFFGRHFLPLLGELEYIEHGVYFHIRALLCADMDDDSAKYSVK